MHSMHSNTSTMHSCIPGPLLRSEFTHPSSPSKTFAGGGRSNSPTCKEIISPSTPKNANTPVLLNARKSSSPGEKSRHAFSTTEDVLGSVLVPTQERQRQDGQGSWINKAINMLHDVLPTHPSETCEFDYQKNSHVGPALLSLPAIVCNSFNPSQANATPSSPNMAPRQEKQPFYSAIHRQAENLWSSKLAVAGTHSPGLSRILTTDTPSPVLPTSRCQSAQPDMLASPRAPRKEETSRQSLQMNHDHNVRITIEDRACSSTVGRGNAGDFVNTAALPACAKNKAYLIDSSLIACGDWRGPLAASESDVLDSEWKLNGAALNMLLAGAINEAHGTNRHNLKQKQAEVLIALATYCKSVVAAQPMLAQVTGPVKVFGDIHGQLRDLLLLFSRFGFPSHKGGDVETTSYVFNGDWVDRGAHQLEVVAVLMALKCVYPTRIFLVRGNHEFRDVSEQQGDASFKTHVTSLLANSDTAGRGSLGASPRPDVSANSASSRVYNAIFDVFEYLPLAALVSGKLLVVHGGIGDGSWGLADLAAVARPLVSAFSYPNKVPLQALWSDPSDSDAEMSWGVHDNPRGQDIATFGADVTRAFCAREKIHVIVRSHQYVSEGYKCMHSGHLITVFSARDYEARRQNCGALLLACPDDSGAVRLRFKTLRSSFCKSELVGV